MCSVVSDSATPWTTAHQAPLSMGFCRQEYKSGLPFPSAGDLPNPGIEPLSPGLQADSLPAEPSGKSVRRWEVLLKIGWEVWRVPAGQSCHVWESDFDGAGWRVLRILNTGNSLHRNRQADGLVCACYATSVAGRGWVKAKKEEKESPRNNRWFWWSTALQNCGSSSQWDREPPGGVSGKAVVITEESLWMLVEDTVKAPGVEAETPVRRPPPSGRYEMAGVWRRWENVRNLAWVAKGMEMPLTEMGRSGGVG